MGTFAYTARDPAGQRVTGTLVAASEQDVLAELKEMDLAPVRLHRARPKMQWRRRISVRHLATTYRQLGDLLRVGMPLLKALQLLGRGKSNPRLAAVMAEIAERIEAGSNFGDAMSRHSDVFPAIQVAMIRAGELGGFLEQVLTRMGGFLEHQADMRSKVTGSLIYPLVLLAVGAGVVVWALVYQVPKFGVLFQRVDMPLPTRMLLATSEIVTRHWLALIGAAVALVLGYMWLRRQPGMRRTLARWQLRIPKLGPLVASLATARFTRILGTLLCNGVPILSAIRISRDAVGHILLTSAIDEAAEAVRAGGSLTTPLADSGMFSEDVVEMIGVGESANNLSEVLIAIAATIEKRVDRMLNIFVRLMEPLLLLCLAGVVLFIFIALIVPMLKMSSSI